ncbi:MAG: hypothetical protein DMF70_10545, partial [Acidobacteria bacterium]
MNVLVLDEPTNHLDIPSREALEEALDAFEGTIITISHDRYFLDRVATQILALDGNGNIEHYNGDYTEFHDWKAARLKDESGPPAPALSEARPRGPQPGSPAGVGRSGRAKSSPVQRKSQLSAVAGGSKRKSGSRASAGSSRVKIIKKPRNSEIIEAEIAELEKR